MNSETVVNYVTGVVSPASSPASYIYSTPDALTTVLAAPYFLTATGNLVQLFEPSDTIRVFYGANPTDSVLLTVASVNVGVPGTPASITFAATGGAQSTSLTLTSAQILAAGAFQAGLSIVPAVAGKVIVPISVTATLVFNTTAYNAFTITPTINAVAQTTVIADTLSAATQSFMATPTLVAQAANLTTLSGQPLTLVASAQPTTGDSPINVNVSYVLI